MLGTQNMRLFAAVVLAVMITFAGTWFFFVADRDKKDAGDTSNQKKIAKDVRISGTITYNALKPEPADQGEVVLSIREHGSGKDFVPIVASVEPSLVNDSAWVVDQVKKNVSYDLRATLRIDGRDVVSSQPVRVTAPADGVEIVLTITWKDLPPQSVAASQNKTISGALSVAGHIPAGATYAIFTAPARDLSELGAEDVDDPQFTRVISGVTAHAHNAWSWSQAIARMDYRVRAELYTAAGEKIGTSQISDAVVPQNDVKLAIQSAAVPPEPAKVVVSGSVKVNGGYKSDSDIVIQVRENGTGGYKDVDRLSVEGDRTWVFKDAKSGVRYDIRAVLRRGDEEKSRSGQQTTTAPAQHVQLTINTDLDLDDPHVKPELISCDKKSDGKYDAKVRFPGIEKARAYWIRLGTENNSGDRFNEEERPDDYGDSVDVKVRINKDTYYYADYAYTYCGDCDKMSSYSDFSTSLKFYCGDKP